MNYTISPDSLDALDGYWRGAGRLLDWPAVFVLPPWLKAWWQTFGAGSELNLRTVRQSEDIIGIAPLRKQGDTVSFLGDVDVCDYGDFIIARGHEADFFNALLEDLKRESIRQLDLKHVRPDSFTMQSLVLLAGKLGYQVITTPEEVSVEMGLPPTWESYLVSLDTKQRHEVKRKLRRLP
jgi:hypothetical protein